jgi:hypothetical protein
MLPFQFIYRGVELGQTIWDKTQVLLVTSWGTHLEQFGNLMGIHWEQGKKNKNSLSPPPTQKERKKLDQS